MNIWRHDAMCVPSSCHLQLTMAPKKMLVKKNSVVKIAKSPIKSVAMNVSKKDMAAMIKDLLKEKSAREVEDQAESSSDEAVEAIEAKGKTKIFWDNDMVLELLEMRCIDYDARFMANKSARQLSKYWSAIALAISDMAGCQISGKQCKSKYSKIKTQYGSIIKQSTTTGNTGTIDYLSN